MNPEIVKFYADKQLHIPKLINKRPSDTTVIQVEVAVEDVYFEIRAGLKIKDLNIARYVWKIAKKVRNADYVSDQTLLQNYKKIITDKNSYIETLTDKLLEKDNLCSRLEIYALIAAVLAVGLVIQEVICIL